MNPIHGNNFLPMFLAKVAGGSSFPKPGLIFLGKLFRSSFIPELIITRDQLT